MIIKSDKKHLALSSRPTKDAYPFNKNTPSF